MFKIFLFILLGSTSTFADTYYETWSTVCNNSDCFRSGWTTVGDIADFRLEASCTNNDCRRSGWTSVDNFATNITVTCIDGDCFGKGWRSVEKRDDESIWEDLAICKQGSCLQFGWDVTSSYDSGGYVGCKNKDCSRYGGTSYWRSRRSITECKSSDCYHKGWKVYFLDPPAEE